MIRINNKKILDLVDIKKVMIWDAAQGRSIQIWPDKDSPSLLGFWPDNYYWDDNYYWSDLISEEIIPRGIYWSDDFNWNSNNYWKE